MYFSQFIGVDISKDTLDAAIYPAKDKKMDFLHFDNTSKGLCEMLAWLKRRGIKSSEMVICAEHTGVYTNPLIAFAEKKGLALGLNSPLDIKHSMGIARGKNDAVDAGRIAEYAHRHQDKLKLYEKPSETIIKLQYLLTERRLYMRQRTALLNINSAMGKYETAEARSRNESAIHHIEKMVKKVEGQMTAIIYDDPEIKRNFDLISSVKGIGLINAINTVVYTNNFKSFETPRRYACYIGVAPFDYTSGISVKGKTQVSKICRTQQKAELSMAARSAIIHDPGLRRYYQRKMKEKGGGKEAHGVVLNAVKFKLILRMFAVVRSGEPYKVLNY
jgi:transposase